MRGFEGGSSKAENPIRGCPLQHACAGENTPPISKLVTSLAEPYKMVHHLQEGAIDAIYGPSDLFLFGATKLITKIVPFYEPQGGKEEEKAKKKFEFSPDQSTFTWLELEPCLKMLGDISHDVFVDALYLAGIPQLEAFPPLTDPLSCQQPFTFRNVIELLSSSNGNVIRLCDQHVHDARLTKSGWQDRYMRAVQAIRHMIVLFHHDIVKPRTYQNEPRSNRAPSDLHELIGLALPEELQYLLYRGVLSRRVLNWLMTGKIKIFAPLSGGDSERYRKLVKEDLQPFRKQSLALLAYSINRYFQQKEITTSFWFGTEHEDKFNIKDLTSPKRSLASWRVRESLLSERLETIKVSLPSLCCTILFADNPSRAIKTLSLEACISHWKLWRTRSFVQEP